MQTIEEYSSVTQMVERLIERENESIALYERTIRQIGDSLIKPLLISIAQEKREHRRMLEHELEELNEQFELEEGIV
jgi:rubrerythrin